MNEGEVEGIIIEEGKWRIEEERRRMEEEKKKHSPAIKGSQWFES